MLPNVSGLSREIYLSKVSNAFSSVKHYLYFSYRISVESYIFLSIFPVFASLATSGFLCMRGGGVVLVSLAHEEHPCALMFRCGVASAIELQHISKSSMDYI